MELAKKVEKLEKLEISHCEKFLKIVEQDNAAIEATVEEFSFPHLTSLNLRMLPQLTCFYPGSFSLECPNLNHLEVVFCANLETFQSQQEAQSSTSVNRQPIFSEGKAIFILESLKLDWKNARMLCNGKFLEDMLHKLVELELDFIDVNQVSNLPVELHEKASNLEYLQISQCRASQPEQGEIRMHEHLKTFFFVCKELHKLCVSSCHHLTTLVHSAVSFCNLKQLSVKDCHGLKHLFTSSAARKLVHLEEMYIVQCESMEEILAEEQEETTSGAIKFERLSTIILDSLSSLLCFYSGSSTLLLSTLIRVLIWKCPNMKTFSRGDIHAESFLGIQGSLDTKEKLIFHQDLNSTVEQMFQQQELFKAIDKECFSDYHELGACWDGEVVSQSKWLCNVLILKLDKCTLPYAIPSSILTCLKNLRELEVRDSDKVKGIFEVNDIEILDTDSRLKILTLMGLSELTHVWANNSQGVPFFQNLQQVVVNGCENLKTLFPASLAKNLKELEKLEIVSCRKLQEIVEKEESATTNVIEKFVFPHLKMLNLYHLPQVTYFYPQTFSLECPSLNNLSVLDCDKLELFQSAYSKRVDEGNGTSINKLPPISYLKVVSNLKELKLDWKHISTLSLMFRSRQFTEDLKHLNKIYMFLDTDEHVKTILPVEILQKAPNLTEVSIEYCNSLEIFFDENHKIVEDGMLGQLRILTLNKVFELQSIKSQIIEKLHELNVFECPDLTSLIHFTATVSFSCLKRVSISNCSQLQYLFTSSVAKKLMNLEEITVNECKSMKEIVAQQGDSAPEAIKFERLNTIVLNSLPSLMCFYSGSDTLQLSYLIKVQIWQCPKMKYFSQGAIDAKSFQGVQMSLDPNDDLLLNQDLNAAIRDMIQCQEFLEALHESYIFTPFQYGLLPPFKNLIGFEGRHSYKAEESQKAALHGKVGSQNKWLSGLINLQLYKCVLPYAIPSGILPHLKNLKKLEVLDCNKVEVIFDMNDTKIMETTSQLQILTLTMLPKLTHVWEKNSPRVLFQSLQQVVVSSCENLQTLFPASLEKNLKELEKLEILSCLKLQNIVEKEEGTATNITEKFVFPHLKMLHLFQLPQLAHFYPQTFTLECPALNNLSVLNCDKLELFQSVHSNGEGESSASINRLPPILYLKVFSNMEELKLDWKHISALSLSFSSVQFTEELKYLNKMSLCFNVGKNEKPILPVEIFQKAPNLMEMTVTDCNSPGMFLTQNPKFREEGMHGQLKILTLQRVSELQSIESEESSWINTISEKLYELNVLHCDHLTTLVHHTSIVSFSCLKKVSISYCFHLQHLFTSSMAKKLMNLEEITVKYCESMKEIVAKQGDSTLEAIKFEQLNTIILHSLPSLICFYSGSDTLQLLSLIKVHTWQCPRMKYFSQGTIDAKSFLGVQLSLDPNDDLLLNQDLNASIREMFQRQNFFEVDGMHYFSDDIELLAWGHRDVGSQNKWLSNLVTLKLDKCTQPYAIPSSILPCLKNLEELEVRDTTKVEGIFEMNDTEILETASRLKILTLKGLSELMHVWEKNSQGVLIFQNLQQVVVSSCKNLQTLFPTLLAKNLKELEKLEIESCDKLQKIVEMEESIATHETEKCVFPHLKMLHLCQLPQLAHFYPQIFSLECPSLNNLSVLDCDKLELFQSSHSKGEREGSTSLNKLPPTSCLKVISNLKELKLDWQHILALSLRFRSGQFTEGLKYLNKISLFLDTDENEKHSFPLKYSKRHLF
ncbi:uncharacterized protein LOC109807690 [Cajanus cajan]|uniref:uncharacterized protein LOC109807690 n=1 Tax=Cajanus cajan TaxID=3821 RepID=UPI00098DC083|nr:uncharacterized protein LOC109807690 [Cajanus cajan]